MTLKLSPQLALPDNFATEGVAAIGMRGSGKSNTLVRWAEVLYGAGIPFVAIDPKGDWGGIRSSADGKKPGLPIPVFGGLSADFPLEERLGARIADVLVDNNMSAVLDVSRLSITGRGRFITEFCNQLMERHQLEPHVRCVILEEAHRYIPQSVTTATAKVKEAAAAILLEGRAFGLGCWAATQRPARLHKDVLEEVGTVVLHRIGAAATNDLRTIGSWVKHEDLGDEITASLTKLANGEAWVLAPSTLGIAQRVQIDRRQTYDSAATPIVGAGNRPTVTLADIDAGAIKEALADAIEKAKADDPAELRKLLKESRTETAKLQAELERRAAVTPETVEVTVEVLPAGLVEELRKVLVDLDLAAKAHEIHATEYVGLAEGDHEHAEHLAAIVEKLDVQHSTPRELKRSIRPQESRAPARLSAPAAPYKTPTAAATTGIGGGAPKRILTALAQYHPEPLSQRRIAALVGVKQKTSTMRNALSALRGRGLITGSDPVAITDAGMTEAGTDPLELPTGDELLAHWRSKLGDGAPRRIFDVLIDAWPAELGADDIASRADVEPGTSTLRNALSRLRSLGLVDGNKANDELMEAIRG